MSKRILVIDDEGEIRALVHEILTDKGYEVITAENGEEGMEKAEATKPDLILLDIKMPKMSGLEFLSALRGHKGIATTPVLMLTAMKQSRNILDSEDMWAVEFLIKPFTVKQLFEAVDKFIR